MEIIDKIAFIHISGRRVLSTLTKGNDRYYIPGGKRHHGESDITTLCREVREELCVEIIKESVKLYGVFEAQAHGKPEGTLVRMTCYTADFTGELKAASEIAEIKWLGYQDMDVISPVDRIIFEDLHGKGLLE